MSTALRRFAIIAVLALAAGLLPTSPAEAKLRMLYAWSFPVGLNHAGVEMPITGRPGAAEAAAVVELLRCFNCSFPLDGAPRRYPRNGQLLPLAVCAGAAPICRPAPVRSYTFIKGRAFRSLTLVAQEGHVDGAGSRVIFSLATNSVHELRLNVTAFVTNPSAPDWANKRFAFSTWNALGQRLGTNMWLHQNCRPVCGKPLG